MNNSINSTRIHPSSLCWRAPLTSLEPPRLTLWSFHPDGLCRSTLSDPLTIIVSRKYIPDEYSFCARIRVEARWNKDKARHVYYNFFLYELMCKKKNHKMCQWCLTRLLKYYLYAASITISNIAFKLSFKQKNDN